MQVRRILRGGHNQRWSRSATGVPERERTERRLGTPLMTVSLASGIQHLPADLKMTVS